MMGDDGWWWVMMGDAYLLCLRPPQLQVLGDVELSPVARLHQGRVAVRACPCPTHSIIASSHIIAQHWRNRSIVGEVRSSGKKTVFKVLVQVSTRWVTC